eukprot:731930-Alexandrium_andersonii.AAC.1
MQRGPASRRRPARCPLGPWWRHRRQRRSLRRAPEPRAAGRPQPWPRPPLRPRRAAAPKQRPGGAGGCSAA